MGWAYGTNAEGREIGYGVEATCDEPGCDEEIDRGLSYVCGGMHDGDEYGCGGYYCHDHLGYALMPGDIPLMQRSPSGDRYPQLCDRCLDAVENWDLTGENTGAGAGAR